MAGDHEVGAEGRDFFISYTAADRAGAEWVAWQLEHAAPPYKVTLQAWDFRPGENFVRRMDEALAQAKRVLAVLSPAYFASEYARDEWTAALVRDRSGTDRLLPVRIAACRLPPLIANRIYIDLVGLTAEAARKTLLSGVRPSGRPITEPSFPDQRDASGRRESGPRLPGELPEIWNVPPSNPNFTGRDRLLVELRERLLTSRATVVQALHGMGGIGKTQLAIEYAYRFASDYDLVWWIPAAQPTLLTQSLHQLAEQLGVTVDEQNTAAVLEAVKKQLRQRHRWLLIFDNAEEPAELASYRPGGDGHMVITSRNPGWGDIAGRLEVDVFTRAESIALLRTRASGLREIDADRLADAVGDLPLALTQAAALLDETGMAPDSYLELLIAQTRELLNEGAPITYPASLAASLQVSLNRIQSEDPAAVCLLELAAFLAPEPIPLSLIADRAGQLTEPLASAAGTPLAFRRGLRLIGRYALGRIQRESLQLHRLVQAVLRDRLDEPRRRGLRRQAQDLLASLPGDPGEPVSWPSYARLTPHVLAIWEQADHVGTQSFRQAILDVARYLERSGQHNTCRQLTDQAWQQWQRHLGPTHRDTLAAAHRLAAALRVLGDHEQARPVAEETLAHRRQVLGDDDPDTLSSASNLGVILNGLGEYRAAHHLAEDTLNRRRRVLGQDHPNTLVSEHNLGLSHQGLGNWEQARQVHQGTLTRRRRLLGDDHPDTLASAHSLAVDLREVGKAWSARKLDEETLARRSRVMGEDHPDTLSSANNLAVDLYTLGESRAARELDEATLVRMCHVLGNDHPHTDQIRKRLGMTE